MTTDDLFDDSNEVSQDVGGNDIGDDPINDPIQEDPYNEDEPSGEEPSGEEPSEEELSGVERYLSDYGIIGGRIQYEDGEFTDFNSLPPDEQYNVLQSLASEARPSIEEDYDLDETEINLLNDIRNSEMSVEDYIGSLINNQVRQSLTVRDSIGIDYTDMPDDAIYMKWLREVSPEMSEDQALEALENQQRNPELFRHQAEQLRGQYMHAQQEEYNNNLRARAQEQNELIEADRYQIVEAVENIDNIGGAEINDQMKNEVLHSLLEINEQGDPLIMEEMFSDPEQLFKAAWFMKYGESYLDNVDKYWKRRESESYKRGRADVLDGAPSTTRGMARNNVIPRPGRSTVDSSGNKKDDSIDALWDD